MIPQFLFKKILQQQLKDLPKEDREKIMNLFLKNPEFFQNLSKEIQKELQETKDIKIAVQKIILKYKDEFKNLSI